MKYLRIAVIGLAFFIIGMFSSGCSAPDFAVPTRTPTPTPTPTRQLMAWATATPLPKNKPSATPTMTLDEALNKAAEEVYAKYGTPTPTPGKADPVRPTSYVRPTATPIARATSTPAVKATATPTIRPTAVPTSLPATATPKPTDTPKVTPTPAAVQTSAPVQKPTVSPTPTKAAAATPTTKPAATATPTPTKTATATPTPTRPAVTPSGNVNATALMKSLNDEMPNTMASLDIFISVLKTTPGDTQNMYYTIYAYNENYDGVFSNKIDEYIDIGNNHSYSCSQEYIIPQKKGYSIYSNPSDDPKKWSKTNSSGTLPAGINLFKNVGNASLVNPKLVSETEENGYEVEMDCKIDLNPMLTKWSGIKKNSNYIRTFKATAFFDRNTLKPTSFVVSAENVALSTDLTMERFWINIYDIVEDPYPVDVPDEIYNAK